MILCNNLHKTVLYCFYSLSEMNEVKVLGWSIGVKVWLESELLRVSAKHFVKKNDPKEEALAILRTKGPASTQKVKIPHTN